MEQIEHKYYLVLKKSKIAFMEVEEIQVPDLTIEKSNKSFFLTRTLVGSAMDKKYQKDIKMDE